MEQEVLTMADCKACGAWFGTATPQDLCPTCERALKRLNGYAVPVVRCKDCKHCEFKEFKNAVCWRRNNLVATEDFCSYGEKREGET